MKNQRITLLVFVFLGNVMTSCTEKKDTPDSDQKPNIIDIISDDQGWTDYSLMGHEHIETPNIDRLAGEGLTFVWGYSAAPLCRPAKI